VPHISRRTFTSLAVSAGLSMTGYSNSGKSRPPYPIAFSTLGCPGWDWKKILSVASENGYSGIELRGIMGQMDLTKRPEFIGTQLNASLKDLSALDLKISDLGASARMHESDAKKRSAAFDEVKRFVDLAARLNARYVRVFGDKIEQGDTREAAIQRIIAGMREMGAHAKGSGVTILIESHGDFTDSKSLLEILKGAEMPTTGLLWDAHHTCAFGKEKPSDTFQALKKYIRHTHLKDSQPDQNGVHYVLTGKGTIPVRDTIKVLLEGGYRGYFCFEWEKAWHAELEEPDIAFPHFADTMRTYFNELKTSKG